MISTVKTYACARTRTRTRIGIGIGIGIVRAVCLLYCLI